jgi:hypothetical protein
MQYMVRLVRTALSLVRGDVSDDVVLRHRANGTVLALGLEGSEPVRFDSADDAIAFCSRFLDEPPAWEPVDLADLDLAAA